MHGLFIGLTTLDLIYRAVAPPTPNQKLVASDYALAAGGPATNAAVTFAHLDNRASLLSVVGAHPMTHLIQADLQAHGVHLLDLDPQRTEAPPVSSIVVTEATGERAVISINAVKTPIAPEHIPANWLESGLLDNVNVVLIDGHQMAIGIAIAQHAKGRNIPVVIDGGSWKPGFDALLPFVDYALCSANFQPPGCQNTTAVWDFLHQFDIPHIAITQGEHPIDYCDRGTTGNVLVPQIQPVDTLGAGDIFHGAFCHFILRTDFVTALEHAAQVAAQACQQFGTRRWMESAGMIG